MSPVTNPPSNNTQGMINNIAEIFNNITGLIPDSLFRHLEKNPILIQESITNNSINDNNNNITILQHNVILFNNNTVNDNNKTKKIIKMILIIIAEKVLERQQTMIAIRTQ